MHDFMSTISKKGQYLIIGHGNYSPVTLATNIKVDS